MRKIIWFCFLVLTGLILPQQKVQADEKPLRMIIDAEVQSAWQREKITPVLPADDSAFLRRVYLDLLGTIPSYGEAKKFLDDRDPQKREKLVDRLLNEPRFADHQTDVWDLVLFGRDPLNPSATRNRDSFKAWLKEQFADNVPYNRWVHELLSAEKDGPEMFLVQFRNKPEDATVGVTRIFLGTQLQCARCHDHPYERWKQRDFYGMAGFFVRLVVINGPTKKGQRQYYVGEKSTGEVMFTGSVKEQKPGQKGEPIKPRFLGGDLLEEPPLPKNFQEPDWRKAKTPIKPFFSRKEKMADWVTSPENPHFARAVVNRIWAQFMGKGLVHPIDDLSENRVPSHPELLKEMARQLIAHKFDLKWLMREITNSKTYQLASTGKVKDASPYWYERARVRPLSAEEMIAALRVATGFDDTLRASGKDPKKTSIPGSMEAYLLRYLGEPTDGRGNFQGSLNEHLLFNNSGQLRSIIQSRKGNLADAVLNSKSSWEDKVDRIYLSVLTR